MPFLSSLFRSFSTEKALESWGKRASLFFLGNPLEKAFFEKNLEEVSFTGPEEEQKALETLLLTLFFFEDKLFAIQNWLLPFFKKIEEETVFEEIPSIFYLKKLCQSFFTRERVFALPKERKSWENFSFFHPHFSLKGVLYKALWAFVCKKEFSEIEKEVTFYESLLDYYGKPFLSLWSSEKTYDPTGVHLDYYLLFYAVGILFKKGSLLEKTEVWKPFLTKEEINFEKKEWVLALFLEGWIEAKKGTPSSFVEKKKQISSVFFPEKGVLGNRFHSISYLFTVTGNNTSLGSFQGKELKIHSFGLQKGFEGLFSKIGFLKRSPLLEEDFQVQAHTNSLTFSGWTALSESFSWIYINVKATSEKVDFTFFSWETASLYLLFYVEAEKAYIQGEVLYPNSLKKVKGSCREVVLEKKGEKWSFGSKEVFSVEVIPLSGEKGFWNSSFLVAFPLQSQKKNHLWANFSS